MPAPHDERPVDYIGGPLRRLFMRYPWRISGLVGVLLITGLRPCTRHIPEAPPIIAPMPNFALSGPTSATATPEDLRGEVWIAGFACAKCQGPPADVSAVLAELSQRVHTHKKPLKVLAIASDVTRDSASWHLQQGFHETTSLALYGDDAAIQSLKFEVARTMKSEQPDLWNRIFIVDQDAKLRGAYALGELGADEAYHRAQHVVREAKIKAHEDKTKTH